ncbi:hypothetical protein [uncultured Treponema sp.]|uniref:hypothetical protein n=1 Tax=uncultured Treponema sp. TaxID=162155 RepID=UPI0025D53021|nr:hypothetical protein [uncultured Treponema sp.]
MKKKILVAGILFCIFSHISAEGYISFGDLKKSPSGMFTYISKICISPEIKEDIEVMKKNFYEDSEKSFQEACKMIEQIANGYAVTILSTACVLLEKDSSTKTAYAIVRTTFLDPNSKYPLGGPSIQVFKHTKDRVITLYEENYNDFNIANAEYERLCKKYIGML